MDFYSFVSSPRWKILEILAREPSSPLELSKKLETSVSYISQQLKLLEAANLVIKQKTGKADRGQPRMVFSLSSEVVYFVALVKGTPLRKLLHLTEHHKTILRIWLLENQNLHYLIEKLYWGLEADLGEVLCIFVHSSNGKVKAIVVSDSKKIGGKVENFVKQSQDKIECKTISENELKKYPREEIFPIYDPKNMFLDKKLKGGIITDDDKI
jgi:DNA-binding PadR family transcriptional regulator